MEIRLNKFISDSGFCSRREADRYIETRNVTVNGKVAEVGTKVTSRDKVRVNGLLIENDNETVYIALNKPVGIVSTTDPTEPDNIVDFVNFPTRIFNIGRLDKPSEGLILLTNDGNIVNKILRAANNHEKEYEVMVNKPITEEFIKKMASGVPILGTVTKKCRVTKEDATRFRIILTQGLNRQIRRMCECLGYEVVKLKRVRIMNITLNKLPSGQWRLLTDEEIETINKSIENSEGGEIASKNAGAGKQRDVKKGYGAASSGASSRGGSGANRGSAYREGGNSGNNGSRSTSGSRGGSSSNRSSSVGSGRSTRGLGSKSGSSSRNGSSSSRIGSKSSSSSSRGGSSSGRSSGFSSRGSSSGRGGSSRGGRR